MINWYFIFVYVCRQPNIFPQEPLIYVHIDQFECIRYKSRFYQSKNVIEVFENIESERINYFFNRHFYSYLVETHIVNVRK